MNITAEMYGHAVVLNVQGEMIEESLGDLQASVDKQLGNAEVIDIVLNLEKVTFVDSAALEYLLDLQDQLAQRLGQVKLAKGDENVCKILEITRLARTFEMYDDINEAVKTVQV